MQQWVEEVKHLSSIAQTQPRAAYSTFVHGLCNKWTYLSRTIPNTEELFLPLEDAIRHHFIQVLTGRAPPSDLERNILLYPATLAELAFLTLQKAPVLNTQPLFRLLNLSLIKFWNRILHTHSRSLRHSLKPNRR